MTTATESTTQDSPSQTAETREEAIRLLSTLEDGDKIAYGGDTYKVISVNTEGEVPSVKTRKLDGYMPGTRTVSPGHVDTLCARGRGMVPTYSSVTKVTDND